MSNKVKNFLSSLFEQKEEETAGGETTVTPTQESDEQVSRQQRVPTPSFSIAGQVSQPDPAYVDVIMKKLEESNLPGVDYFELREATTNMASTEIIPVEKALQNSFSTLRVADKTLTVEKLISSSDHYIRVVTQIRERFFQESSEQIRLREQQLGTFRKDFEALVGTLNDDELEKKFLSSSNGILEESLLQTKQKEEMRQAKMALVCDSVVSQITNDQTLIQRVLQGGVK